jgi:ribosomal protein L11 methyltransferase
MSDDTWRLLSITVPNDEIDLVSDFLWSQGVVAVEELQRDSCTELRTSLGTDINNLSALIKSHFPHVQVDVVGIASSVADTWREFAEAVIVSESLQIIPAWKKVEKYDERRSILIDPEDTFGLGNHSTTIGALRMGLQVVQDSQRVFDYGCGSGVLGIALAAIKGCAVSAYDIANSARDVLGRNCQRNNVTVQWIEDPLADFETFDVVIANILAPVLKQISSNVLRMTGENSIIVLAGMRTEQWPDVASFYTNCDVVNTEVIDGWICVALRVRGSATS